MRPTHLSRDVSMGCANAKTRDRSKDAKLCLDNVKIWKEDEDSVNFPDDHSFDPRLLQDSWKFLRKGSNEKKGMSRFGSNRRRGTLTRNWTRNRKVGKKDEISNLENLLPHLIDGFQRGMSFIEKEKPLDPKRSRVRFHHI